MKIDKLLDELEAKYEELGKEIERLKAEKVRRFKPEIGDEYYFLISTGEICCDKWGNSGLEKVRLSMSNVYSTRKEAERTRDKQEALVRLQDIVNEVNGDWVADWSDGKQEKAELSYDYGQQAIFCSCVNFSQTQGAIYFNPEKFEAIKSRLTQEDINLIFDLGGE